MISPELHCAVHTWLFGTTEMHACPTATVQSPHHLIAKTGSRHAVNVKKRAREAFVELTDASLNKLDGTPLPSKRRKVATDGAADVFDNERTPRGNVLASRLIPSLSSNSSVRSSNGAAASTNRSQSPSKLLAEMEVASEPVAFRQFTVGETKLLPTSLRRILRGIEDFSRGLGVIPDDFENFCIDALTTILRLCLTASTAGA